jgi:malate dehydrogenase (oxaloacetate-decarboxylating)(NADP+)
MPNAVPTLRSYPGMRRRRATGIEYDDFVSEFMSALKEWQPHILLQFEDFGNENAFRYVNLFPWK